MTAHPRRQQTSDPARNAALDGAAGMTEFPAQFADSLRGLSAIPLAMAVESLRFASRRMLAHAAHLSEIANCHSLAEAAEAQSGFAQETLNDYRAEAETLMTEFKSALTPPGAPPA